MIGSWLLKAETFEMVEEAGGLAFRNKGGQMMVLQRTWGSERDEIGVFFSPEGRVVEKLFTRFELRSAWREIFEEWWPF
jgi:hypothetical protein